MARIFKDDKCKIIMRVIWIMSRPLLGTLGTANHNHTGSWIDAAFDSLKDNPSIEIHAISMSNCKKIKREVVGRHVAYMLPKSVYCNPKQLDPWRRLSKEIIPDLLMVWGSEQGVALSPVMALNNIPRVVYIQGFLDNIVANFNGGLSTSEILKTFTFWDLFRLKWFPILKYRYKKRAEVELKVLQLSDAVILENDWCAGQIRTLTHNRIIYRSLLPIKSAFFNYDWNIKCINRHSLFVNAGGLPLKGHHTLFKALGYVVKRIPDIRLRIPGNPIDCSTLKKRIKTVGYHRYLYSLLKKYNIVDNVEYLGILPSFDDMAKECMKCNAFIMPSYVENHSSSLIEAMIVGAPCIATYVGGVQNITINGENALVYNPSDAVALADNIIRILSDDKLAISLSEQAKLIRPKRKVDIGEELLSIYRQEISLYHAQADMQKE